MLGNVNKTSLLTKVRVSMANLIARLNYGGIDLCNGCPDLRDATIVKVDTEKNAEEYRTMLTIRDRKGLEHSLIIIQEY